MEKFKYRAVDNQGKKAEGLVEANNQQAAVKILQSRNLVVIHIAPQGKSFLNEISATFFNKVTSTDKINFTRQLSTMMTAGLPLTEALNILESQSSPAMGRVVGEILRSIESGGSLSKALEKHHKIFDEVYISLVRAGETAGILDNVLARLAENLEKQREFISKVKGAMLYPAIVIGGMTIVATIMILFVIPKLSSLYSEFQTELPIATKILLKGSKLASDFWFLGLGGLLFLVIAGPKLLTYPLIKTQYDRLFFRLPILGNLRKQIMLTEFTRILGLLIGSGVLIVDSLEIVKGSLGSPLYEKAVSLTVKNVQKGFPLAVALGETQVFPLIVPQMISVGEETGKLDEVLGKVSNYYSQEAEISIKNLTTALEPLIMILMGVGVGFLIIAIIMPIYKLTSAF